MKAELVITSGGNDVILITDDGYVTFVGASEIYGYDYYPEIRKAISDYEDGNIRDSELEQIAVKFLTVNFLDLFDSDNVWDSYTETDPEGWEYSRIEEIRDTEKSGVYPIAAVNWDKPFWLYREAAHG